jgi:hypothetical protein
VLIVVMRESKKEKVVLLSSQRQNTGVFLLCKTFWFGPQTVAKATTEYRVQTTETCGGWAENCKDKRANFNICGGW